MIAPDSLLKTNVANVGIDGAAMDPIQPTVGAPLQRVGHRMGIVESETHEPRLGITVWSIIRVTVGIEQQIR